MRTKAEIDSDILDAARKIHNAGAQMGQGYKDLLAALNEHYQGVFDNGGGLSATDFVQHAGTERVRTDIIGLLIAAGLGDVLVQAVGRKDFNPEPQFYQRYEGLVESGVLVASRGKPHPNPDPLSGYAHPGIRVHATGSGGQSPRGRAI